MEELHRKDFPSFNFTTTEVAAAFSHTTTSEFLVSAKPLPIDMRFNDGHKLAITLYSLLMIISAIGNLFVFSAIVRLSRKGRLSRINLFLLNLNIADLLVTFVMMPLEIVWNKTVSWEAGDWMCRIMSFFRVFGLYLSGFVLVCISLDRCISVMNPVVTPDSQKRAKIMLGIAWIGSFFCSLPQSFIFHVEAHPQFLWYEQCITFNSFSSRGTELTYNFFCFFFMYGFPMLMIITCYSCILCKMYCCSGQSRSGEALGSSHVGALGRAKARTLKMSVVIVITFFVCWTPYNVMSLWYWIDKESAQGVDQRIQKGFFMFACTNSCVNPLIYGMFHFRSKPNYQAVKMRLQRGTADTEV